VQTKEAEVVVCNGARAVLIDEDRSGAEWHPTSGDWELLSRTDAIFVGGSLPDGDISEICHHARQHDIALFANPTRLQSPRELNLEGVCILQVSSDDLANFGFPQGAPAAQIAELFLARGAQYVVVTDSERGARAFDQGGHSTWMPAVPARVPLFPTGCGDAVLAAQATGFLIGLGMYDWLNLGSLAGGYFVEHGKPATWREILKLAYLWPPSRRF
jgi:sugar/nucleoside kinase (ribokinase family)